ncbi:MAG: hypothetical protein NTW26_00185, partial [bacterium]|nr:hypothetical protein [bacterium]
MPTNHRPRRARAALIPSRRKSPTDDDTVNTATGAPLGKRYVLVSVIGSPKEISVFSTILSVQTAVDETALKTSLGITEDASLLGGYAPDGEIAGYVAELTPLYADLYAGAAGNSALNPAQVVSQVAETMIADATFISDYVEDALSEDQLPPSNASTTSKTVGDEIFQSIPIDAATMSFGIGLNEITRKVVSGAYCLEGLQSDLTPELSLCQNTRSYLFRLVKSEKDLRDLLNVGGGLDLGTTVVSGSLEGRFVDEMKKDSSSIYALIKAEYILCGYKIFDVTLNNLYLNGDATHASYTSNYEAFRAACGDRYLDTIATGGSYYGLLKIQTDSLDHKQDLTVALEGKYGKAGISVSVSGDLKSSVSEVIKNENITITVGSRGVSPEFLGLDNGKDQLIDNLDDFFDAADQFLDAISNSDNECHDDAVAFKNCAYTASFADYATVAQANVRNATQV